MLFKGEKLISQVQKIITDTTGESVMKNIGAIYQGTKLVWRTISQAIRSCFGSGTWLGDKPWIDSDNWKD